MARSWTPPNVSFVASTLLAGCALFAAASFFGGCSTQETNPSPDAAKPECKNGPFIFCQPVGADVPSCNTDDGTSPFLTRLPRGTRYPVGCVINYVGERDEQGDCRNEAVCKCLIGESIPPSPAPDGGTGGDASPQQPPPPPGPSAPTWNCAP